MYFVYATEGTVSFKFCIIKQQLKEALMKSIMLLALIFSLTLVVSLPFVQASTLQIKLLSGKDKINGYAKSNDELVLEALAAIDGDNAITPEQVRISVGSAVVFPQKCRQNEKEFLCTYNEPIVNRKEANTYGVILVDDAGENILQAGQSLVIDDEPPAIIAFDSQEITGGAGTIEYNIQDGNYINSCSGVKNVRLSIADTIISEKTFEQETCSAHEALAYEYKQNGAEQLCITATDYLDQKTELCRKTIIDTEPPTLLSAGLYENGKQIKHIRPEGGLFSIGATLQDASSILPENIIFTLDKICFLSRNTVALIDRVVEKAVQGRIAEIRYMLYAYLPPVSDNLAPIMPEKIII